MASVVLGTVGAAVGGGIPFAPGIGSALGATLGAAVGGSIDNAVFGMTAKNRQSGARLADLSVQVSTYGKMIPLLYGTARIAGNVIWSQPIKETANRSTSSSGAGKGSGGTRTTTASYSYSVSLAIALCEGPIQGILRVWADAKQLDLSEGTYRIYFGDEAQLPDSYMQGFDGVSATPAYRGLAYVVIEDFPLADYGNRIPNFTFEVQRNLKGVDYHELATEDMIASMILIPGAGEFVYDTAVQSKTSGEEVSGRWIQSGVQTPVNMQNPQNKANLLVALDQLQATCPNVEWVSVVVTWFGTSLDAGACEVRPGAEYQGGAVTSPDTWSVAGLGRGSAHAITIIDGGPRYGGTPDDAGLLSCLAEIRRRGLKVMLLPMFFMDIDDKPWRGRVTGSATDVANFFTKTHGYNAFLMHYANLVAGRVDAFAIGSELIGLTAVVSSAGQYPAVDALVTLAASARGVLGAGVTLTYAADWSEYHHTTGGWYNLDPLWASPNIDVIGIDAYFPLTEGEQDNYDVQSVIDGWTSGEGYDYIYDAARTVQTPIAPAYAGKNLAWFWGNHHVNPDGATTGWVPQSKKIWFTEYGFPSVDSSTNQPNVFYDPTSSESFFPRDSTGAVDFLSQRRGITGTEAAWAGSNMVERRFLWTWDARPYPYFPDLLDVWSDGGVWITGHWVNGKLGLTALSAIVSELCGKAGLDASLIDVSALVGRVGGFVVSQANTARGLIEMLTSAYFFDARESNDRLEFLPRKGEAQFALGEDDLVRMAGKDVLTVTRTQELDLPQRYNVNYLNRTALYQTGTQSANRAVTQSRDVETLTLPLVFSAAEAKAIAEASLYRRWLERSSFRFYLGNAQATLEAGDVVTLNADSGNYLLRVTGTLSDQGNLRVDAVTEDASIYRQSALAGKTPGLATAVAVLSPSRLELLDLPVMPGDDSQATVLHAAVAGLGANWHGAVLYRSDDGGANYTRLIDLGVASAIGNAVDTLQDFTGGNRFDEAGTVTVRLVGNEELQSMTALAVYNGANAALVGKEIVQFRDAVEIEAGKYQLSGLLRGRLGTEWANGGHMAGERFVLLSGLSSAAVPAGTVGLTRQYKGVSIGGTLGSTDEAEFTYRGNALKPYAPVHVTGTRNGGGDVTISWIRRTRAGGEWMDQVDVPLMEASEAYQIDIVHAGNVLRTLSAASPTTLYTAAMQTADFGSLPATMTARIYQMSERAGRGYGAENTF